MSTSARPDSPANGRRPALRTARKAATDSYIVDVTAHLDRARASALAGSEATPGEVTDAVTQQLTALTPALATTQQTELAPTDAPRPAHTSAERLALSMPTFELLDATPARELIAPTATPYALIAATPAEIDEAISALENELQREDADTPTAEIPALAAPQPALTRAQIHGSRRRRTLLNRAVLLVAGLVVAWVAAGVGAALLGPVVFEGYFILSLAAVAYLVARPQHESRHARGYVPRHGRR